MISVENLTVHAGNFALRDVNFAIQTRQYAVLMGKTGCGKTMLLEAICGLRRPSRGTIRLSDVDVTLLKPAERGIGYVPQDRCVFQTMTVRDNLAFALHVRKWDAKRIALRVEELAELLGIGHLLDRRPRGLSGGESQRVALGRALAMRPKILCLDEPLSALDAQTREEIYQLLNSIKTRTHVTTLHITHDWNEAGRLADRLCVFDNGIIREIDNLIEFDRLQRPTRTASLNSIIENTGG